VKVREPIYQPDVTNESPEYWEKVLTSHDLSMDRGYQPDLVSYIGDLENLKILERRNAKKMTGKVFPAGHGPDE